MPPAPVKTRTRLDLLTLEDRWVPVAPVNSIPGTQFTFAGSALAFSTANGNGMSVSDPDGPGPFEIQVSMRNVATGVANVGTVSVGTTTGLTVNGNGTIDLQLIGSLADVNAALDSIVYTPQAGFNGQARLVLESDDEDGPGGLSDTDFFNITVSLPALTPSVTNASTNEDIQTNSGLVISRNAANGSEVTHFQITNIQNGALFKADGTTTIADGDFITFAQANAGLKFTPSTNFFGAGSFGVQASVLSNNAGLGGSVVTATITVNPVSDTPTVTNATTSQSTQTTSGLVITRNAADGSEVTHFQITNIQNGTLFLNDGTTNISNGSFITFAQGNAGLKFTPAAGFTGSARFDIQASVNNGNGGLGGNVVTATVTVNVAPPAPPPVLISPPPAVSPPTPTKVDLFAVATGAGTPVRVNVFNADGSLRFNLQPFGGFLGGATVATGDVTGDGIDDIAVGAGAGGGPHVKLFDGATGAELRSFFAYSAGFKGGVFVGLGDVNGDGLADIVTGTGAGGGPHVKVFDAVSSAEVRSFFAYNPAFLGGVSVRAGDINADGFADIITGAGPGGGPHVKAFSGKDLSVLQSFFAGDVNDQGGVLVGVGNFLADAQPGIVASVNGRVGIFGSSSATELNLTYVERGYFVPFGQGIQAVPATIRLSSDNVALLIGSSSRGAKVKIIDGTSNLKVNMIDIAIDGILKQNDVAIDGVTNNQFPVAIDGVFVG